MTPKKLTRGIFYALFAVGVTIFISYATEAIVRNWNSVSDIFLALALTAGFYGIFRLFMWAFLTEDKK